MDIKRNERKLLGKIKIGDGGIGDKIYENFSKINKPKTIQDERLIMSCLKKHFVFKSLSSNQM